MGRIWADPFTLLHSQMHMWNRRAHQDRGGRSKCGKISQDTQLSDLAFTQNGKYPWIGVINFASNNGSFIAQEVKAPFQAGKYPWIMSVNFGSTDGSKPGGCAATLIATNWAITAAHCITDTNSTTKDSLSLVLGEYNISSSTDSWDTKR